MDMDRVDAILPPAEDKKVAIFGGSFNPPHLGHAMMTLVVLMTQDIDEVWILPCADHAFKGELETFEKRMKMCENTFGHLTGTKVLELESILPKPSYTVQTLSTIKKARPDVDLHFMIGGDLVEEVPDWSNSEGLTDLATFIVVPRQGYPIVEPPPELGSPIIVELGLDLPELSSTLISKLHARGVSIEGFVEKSVHKDLDLDVTDGPV